MSILFSFSNVTVTNTNTWVSYLLTPSQVQLYQFMAKDNVPFHTVVFGPQLPLGAEDNHTLLNHMRSMGEGFEGRGVFCVLCAGQFNNYVSV